MRFVSGIGTVVFAYLALIPFTLIGSTLDSACSGPGCDTALPVEVLLVGLYAASLLALAGTAVVFADHAIRGRDEALAREPFALRVCGAVVGVTLFLLFCLISPIGGVIATLVGVVTWRLLARHNASGPGLPETGDPRAAELRRRAGGRPADPNLN
jgi:hypothetical protein